jgi:ABC-2 type transport system permease protein
MGTIFWKIIKDRRISIIVYCVAAIALMWMYVAMYPSIEKQAASFTEAFKNYPQAMMKAMGIEMMDFSHLENFLAMEQFSIIWPIMVIFLMVAFASNSLAREVEKGTAEILLSRPVSRLKIFFGRYLAGIVVLLVFTILSTVTVAPLAELHSIDYQFVNYLKTGLTGFFFGWAFFSMAMMISAMSSEKSRVAMTIGGVAIAMYVLKIVASLIERFDWLQYVSFFYYFNGNDGLLNSTVKILPLVVFSIVSIVCTAIGAWYFKKRDIAV